MISHDEAHSLLAEMYREHDETAKNTAMEGVDTFNSQEEEFYWELGYIRAMEEVLNL